MSNRSIGVDEATTGWPSKCMICGSTPTRWRIELPEPDRQGRRVASFCEQHERNKDMLIASFEQPEPDLEESELFA